MSNIRHDRVPFEKYDFFHVFAEVTIDFRFVVLFYFNLLWSLSSNLKHFSKVNFQFRIMIIYYLEVPVLEIKQKFSNIYISVCNCNAVV